MGKAPNGATQVDFFGSVRFHFEPNQAERAERMVLDEVGSKSQLGNPVLFIN